MLITTRFKGLLKSKSKYRQATSSEHRDFTFSMMVEDKTVFPAPGIPWSQSERLGSNQCENSWDEMNHCPVPA
jgi:hypothetical protein